MELPYLLVTYMDYYNMSLLLENQQTLHKPKHDIGIIETYIVNTSVQESAMGRDRSNNRGWDLWLHSLEELGGYFKHS